MDKQTPFNSNYHTYAQYRSGKSKTVSHLEITFDETNYGEAGNALNVNSDTRPKHYTSSVIVTLNYV